MAPGTIAAVLGREAVEGQDYVRARLTGWTRAWSVCTDNTTSREVHYYAPGTAQRPPIQVLFLNVEPSATGSTVDGVVISLADRHLRALDRREGNYDRVAVTGAVTLPDGTAFPDVVWTYAGKPDRVRRTRAAIRDGTARIRREYLDAARAAFAAHDGLAATLESPPVPVIPLDRRVIRTSEARISSRPTRLKV